MGWGLTQATCRENHRNKAESRAMFWKPDAKISPDGQLTSISEVGSSAWKSGWHPVSKAGPRGRSVGPEEEPPLACLHQSSGRAPAFATPSTVVGFQDLATQSLASLSQAPKTPLSGLQHGTIALLPCSQFQLPNPCHWARSWMTVPNPGSDLESPRSLGQL